MGNISAHAPLGPDASPWYPVDDGNYTIWHGAFEKKISHFCGDDYDFQVGRKIKPDSLSQKAFSGLYSGGGVGHLREAIRTSSLGGYIGSKPGSIVLIAFAIVLLAIAIAFALLPVNCCRSCVHKRWPWRKDDNLRCKEQQASNGTSTKAVLLKLLAFLTFALLFGLGISSVLYAARLEKAIQSTTCDFWLTSYGHFFGTKGNLDGKNYGELKLHEVSLPDGAVSQWLGTANMWTEMRNMSDSLNPSDCVMCRDIVKAYNGTGGMVETLEGSGDKVWMLHNQGIVVLEAVASMLEAETNNKKLGFSTNDRNKAILKQARSAAVLFRSFYTDLNKVTQDGVRLFRENLDRYLGPDSALLAQAYNTAVDATDALGDVNYLLAKILVMWDSDVYPLVRGLVTTLVVLTILAGVFAICCSIFGFYLLWRFHRESTGKYPGSSLKMEDDSFVSGEKLRKLLVGIYSTLCSFSGLIFILFAVVMLTGSVGSDACRFVDQNVFVDGDWDAFPARLLGETVTNKTNMAAVLDTCVRDDGDGDVAGTLNLRVLLNIVRKQVDMTATSLRTETDDTLMLNFRDQKTTALVQLAKDNAKLITEEPGYIVYKDFHQAEAEARCSNGVGEKSMLPFLAMNPKLVAPTYRMGLLDLLMRGVEFDFFKLGQITRDVTLQASNIAEVYEGIDERKVRMDAIWNSVTADIGKTNVCSPVLDKAGICDFDADKSIDLTNEKIDEEELRPLYDAIYEAGGFDAIAQITQAIHEAYSLQRFLTVTLGDGDIWDSSATLLTNFTAELPGLFEDTLEGGVIPGTLTVREVLERLVPNVADYCETLDNCTRANINNALDDYLVTLADGLEYANQLGQTVVYGFVENTTLARFYALLDNAEGDLAEFNCQYLGTTLRESVRDGLCEVAMPTTASLGLIALCLSIVSVSGAWLTWRAIQWLEEEEAEVPVTGVASFNVAEEAAIKGRRTSAAAEPLYAADGEPRF